MHGVEVDRLTARSRLSVLAQASAQLAVSRDLRAAARGVADSLVPRLADPAQADHAHPR